MHKFNVGVDLAETTDYTALCILEAEHAPIPSAKGAKTPQEAVKNVLAGLEASDKSEALQVYNTTPRYAGEGWDKVRWWVQEVARKGHLTEDERWLDPIYYVTWLERMQGIPYTRIVARIGQIVSHESMTDEQVSIYLDATGVGRPVIEQVRQYGERHRIWSMARAIAIVITGGKNPNTDGRDWTVPKADLAWTLRGLLEKKRLRIVKAVPERDVLLRELQNFTAKQDAKTGHVSYEAWRTTQHDDLVLGVAIAAYGAARPRGIFFA